MIHSKASFKEDSYFVRLFHIQEALKEQNKVRTKTYLGLGEIKLDKFIIEEHDKLTTVVSYAWLIPMQDEMQMFYTNEYKDILIISGEKNYVIASSEEDLLLEDFYGNEYRVLIPIERGGVLDIIDWHMPALNDVFNAVKGKDVTIRIVNMTMSTGYRKGEDVILTSSTTEEELSSLINIAKNNLYIKE